MYPGSTVAQRRRHAHTVQQTSCSRTQNAAGWVGPKAQQVSRRPLPMLCQGTDVLLKNVSAELSAGSSFFDAFGGRCLGSRQGAHQACRMFACSLELYWQMCTSVAVGVACSIRLLLEDTRDGALCLVPCGLGQYAHVRKAVSACMSWTRDASSEALLQCMFWQPSCACVCQWQHASHRGSLVAEACIRWWSSI